MIDQEQLVQSLKTMSDAEKKELYDLLLKREAATQMHTRDKYFADEGVFRRDLYPKHVDFMNAGASKKIRLAMSANRVGKTLMLCYEVSSHLTGDYPHWWQGRVYDRPVTAVVASDTHELNLINMQSLLIGDDDRSGLLPKDSIGDRTDRSKPTGSIDMIKVKHRSGGWSRLYFRAYQQGSKVFRAFSADFVGLDEPPPEDILSEAMTRTMTTEGLVVMTFTATPDSGVEDLVMRYARGAIMGRPEEDNLAYVTTISWDDVPHLTQAEKDGMLANYRDEERSARTTGIPKIGAGNVYGTPWDKVEIPPFDIPKTWPVTYCIDPGWKRTGVLWAAQNPMSGVIYIYAEYFAQEQQSFYIATAINEQCRGITGLIDKGKSITTGETVAKSYRDAGLDVVEVASKADKNRRIDMTSKMLHDGKIRVFSTCTKFAEQYAMYVRDKNGNVSRKSQERDDLMNALEYLVQEGRFNLRQDSGEVVSLDLFKVAVAIL